MSEGHGDGLMAVFREEALDSLARLGRLVMDLESLPEGAPQHEAVREIFRLAHSLKGSAATVGRTDLAQVAHELETCLDAVRRREVAPSRGLVDACLAGLDILGAGLSRPLTAEEIARAEASLSAFHPRQREKQDEPGRVAQNGKVVDSLFTSLLELGRGNGQGRTRVLELARSAASDPVLAERSQLARSFALLMELLACPPMDEVSERAIVEAATVAADLLQTELTLGASAEECAAVEACLASALSACRSALFAPKSDAAAAPVPAPASAEPNLSSAEATVRVRVELLDSILYRLDELVAAKLRIDHQRRQVEDLQEISEAAARAAPSAAGGDLRRRLEALRRDLVQEVHGLGMLAQSLQDDVREVRMMAVGPLLEPFRRAARDLAHRIGKEAALLIRGEDVRVDKRLMDLMRDPLMHLIRNAIDHGIEDPAVRRARHKDERGLVEIAVESRESQVLVEVRDDGGGIDPARLRAAAVEKGLMDSERAAALSEREALDLIFLPGFSTAAVTTDISGRGVGMDVVRENVGRLGGRIDFSSVPGQGTRFLLSLPLTLAAARGLFVRSERDTYCIPLSAVEEARALRPDEVGLSEGQHFLKVRSQAVPFVQLGDLLSARPSRRPEQHGLAVVLALSDRRVAVGVDEVVGQEEMVVRSLAGGTPPLKLVAGATAIADGTLVTVLEPAALLEAMREVSAARGVPPAKSRQRTVLVVDDALTTRTMLVSLLERVGFRTLAAADGEAGFALLRTEPVDLVVSDVEMPGLDGVALTRRIRVTAGMERLPVILVTSLGGPADRARGAESGANGYVVKSDFDPDAFVQMVREELGGEELV